MIPAEGPIWEEKGAAKRAAVQRMFGEIAGGYDRVNGWMSLGLHHAWRGQAVERLGLRPGDAALDVCCGTGDFLRPLRQAVGPSGTLVGLDFCAPMLTQARQKDASAQLVLGDAGRLPLPDREFDGVTVGWGLRNVPDLDGALAEITRVLRPGGRFVTLDCAIPQSPLLRSASLAVTHRVLPRIGAMVGNAEAYTYLPNSVSHFASRERLAASMERAGLVDVRFEDRFFGNICLHFGRKP
jgi:demethylmenaquinone methyltransferase/2-methoxy-6-polyprenyl-1,4-benzoquinol methylase